ncbi:MAG: glycosyl transferase family 39 [Clostridia bacterium]|nr:glycosyl transferase family 39 [Clostridia bacterium]
MSGRVLYRNRQLWIVVLVFLFIFILRIPYINNSTAEMGELWRQTDTESIARNFIKYKFNIFYPQFNYDGVPPIYVQLEFQITTFLIAILYKVFGYHIWLARLVPISFFMLSVYYLYLVAKIFFPMPQSLLVIMIYSILPINIYFSRAIMPEAALLCFFNGAFYFFLKWRDNQHFSTLIIAALFTCLAISQKLPAAFMGLAMIAMCLEKYSFKILKQWQLWVFAAISLIPNLLYFLWLGTIAEQKFVTGIAVKHIIPKFLTAMNSTEAMKFFTEKLPEAFGKPILFLALIGMLTVLHKKERPLLYWAVAMLLEVLLIVSVIKFKYYLIMLAPILALLAGKIIGMLWNKHYIIKAVLLLLIFAFAYHSYLSVQKEFEVQHWLIQAAEIIDTYTQPQDLIIISTFHPVILTLSDRAGWRANLKYHEHIPKEMVEEMNYYIQQGADYFLVYKNYIYNDKGSYLKYLNENFEKKSYGKDFVMYKLK